MKAGTPQKDVGRHIFSRIDLLQVVLPTKTMHAGRAKQTKSASEESKHTY
jgi:hypothetical protein